MTGKKTKKVNMYHRGSPIGYITFNKQLHFAIEGSKKICLDGKPMEAWKRAALISALTQSGGNRRDAAKILEIGERTLYRMCKDFGL